MGHLIHLSKVQKGNKQTNKKNHKDFNAEGDLKLAEKGFAAVFRKNSSVMF